MNDKVRKGRLKAAGLVLLILAVSLAAIGIFELAASHRASKLEYLQTGERWSGGRSRYAVINAYTEESEGVSADQLLQWEYSMNSALTEAAVETDEKAKAWTWCASFGTVVTAEGPKGTQNAETTVCAGDFFVFHPFDFTYGSGFSTDGLNPMGVVLDSDLAWKLFGAENIVGMTLTVGGLEYTVTGVYEPESDRGLYAKTYGDVPRMYMSSPGYAKIAECSFTAYETALPDPVKSFARNIFDTVVTLNGDRSEIIEVTSRFTLRSRYDNMKKLGWSWMRVNRIGFPFWENEARVYDYRSAEAMIWEIVCASVGGAALLTAIVLVVTSGYSPVTSVKNAFAKAAQLRKKRKNNT